ncbi:hypothetical protein QBL07_023560 [Gordonia rubripertincta]|uniref:hypothetical protein n=1 Tax=Gordonia rubripertincta TaxID=36822 RepID=UPI0039B56AF6
MARARPRRRLRHLLQRRQPRPSPEAAPEPGAPEVEEAQAAEAPAAEAPAETNGTEVPTPSGNGSGDTRTIAETGASKSKGFGIAAGKKRPGHK